MRRRKKTNDDTREEKELSPQICAPLPRNQIIIELPSRSLRPIVLSLFSAAAFGNLNIYIYIIQSSRSCVCEYIHILYYIIVVASSCVLVWGNKCTWPARVYVTTYTHLYYIKYYTTDLNPYSTGSKKKGLILLLCYNITFRGRESPVRPISYKSYTSRHPSTPSVK